jgi:hypothetical protein
MASGASKESLLERLDKGVTNSEQERVTISSQNDTPKGLRKDPFLNTIEVILMFK